MAKSTKSHGLLNGESHTSRLKRLYGDQFDASTTKIVEEKLAKQSNLPEKLIPSVNQKKTMTDEQILEGILTVPHPLDDAPDPLSPPTRRGRRIATRQSRDHGVLIKFTSAEHDTIRRVAAWYGYSLAQTFRLLAREKEKALWPNEQDLPNILQLDMDEKKRKAEAEKKTKNHQQKRLNAFQRKEMKLKQEAERLQIQQEKLKAREEKALAGIKQMEAIRAAKRAGTKKMNKEIDAKALHERESYKEVVLDVEVALLREMERLGRKLTESEKWEIGKRVRANVSVEIEKELANAILDAERKAKRKLSMKEKWEIRTRIRPEVLERHS